MTKQNDKAVTVVGEERRMALASMVSEFEGAVQVRSEILKVARLKLTQAMSGASSGGLAKPGEFTCEVKSMNYGTEISVIPLLLSESASLLSEDGQVICSSADLVKNREGIHCSHCPYDEYFNDWGSKGNKKVPKCKLAIDATVLVNDEKEPAIISFRKMSHAAGKELVNQVVRDPRKVPFGSKYKLTSSQETRDKYKFFVVNQNIIKTPLTDEEVIAIIPIAKKVLDAKKKGALKHEEEMGEDVPM